jgi:hypothetical protein
MVESLSEALGLTLVPEKQKNRVRNAVFGGDFTLSLGNTEVREVYC